MALITQEGDTDFIAHVEIDKPGVWLTVGKWSLYIKRTSEGVIVDGYPFGQEACEAVSLQLWDEDIAEEEEEQTPPRQTVTLSFLPQSWVRDNAIEVDADKPREWQVDRAEFLKAFPTRGDFDSDHDARDDLRLEGNAPKWIREWTGPFEVELFSDPWNEGEAA